MDDPSEFNSFYGASLDSWTSPLLFPYNRHILTNLALQSPLLPHPASAHSRCYEHLNPCCALSPRLYHTTSVSAHSGPSFLGHTTHTLLVLLPLASGCLLSAILVIDPSAISTPTLGKQVWRALCRWKHPDTYLFSILLKPLA